MDPNSTSEPTVAPTPMPVLIPLDNIGEVFEKTMYGVTVAVEPVDI